MTRPYEAVCAFTSGGTGVCKGNVYGTYLHGFFDRKEIFGSVLSVIAAQTGKTVDISTAKDMKIFKEEQYEILDRWKQAAA